MRAPDPVASGPRAYLGDEPVQVLRLELLQVVVVQVGKVLEHRPVVGGVSCSSGRASVVS